MSSSGEKFFLTLTRELDINQAIQLQEKLRDKIILRAPFSSSKEIRTVAGTDLHFSPDEKEVTTSFAYTGIVVVSFPEMKIIEQITIKKKVTHPFPYLPTLLSFREIPYLLEAYKKLKTKPDIILCDGQGIAHPRRMGLATHFGILLDKPTIGCAKSLLYGKYEKMPARSKGSYTYLKDEKGDLSAEALAKAEIIGAILRTKNNVRPVFVSPGYKMNLELAMKIVLKCCTKYRISEPLRFAHQHVKNRYNLKLYDR